jgi:hypothetical protein
MTELSGQGFLLKKILCAAAGKGWRLILLTALISVAAAPAFGDMARLTDFPSEDGFVDWEGGFVYAYGRGPFPETVVRMAEGRQLALKTAWRAARTKLSQITTALFYNSEIRVGDLLKEDARSQKEHRRFLLAAEPVRIMARMDASMALWIRAPLYGPSGLATISGRGEGEMMTNSGTGVSKPFLVLILVPKPGVSKRCLWPIIHLPDGSLFLDTAPNKEGLSSRDFTIYRIGGDFIPDYLPFSSTIGEKASKAVYHSNGIDLILVDEPEDLEAPDRNAYGGLVILEPGD